MWLPYTNLPCKLLWQIQNLCCHWKNPLQKYGLHIFRFFTNIVKWMKTRFRNYYTNIGRRIKWMLEDPGNTNTKRCMRKNVQPKDLNYWEQIQEHEVYTNSVFINKQFCEISNSIQSQLIDFTNNSVISRGSICSALYNWEEVVEWISSQEVKKVVNRTVSLNIFRNVFSSERFVYWPIFLQILDLENGQVVSNLGSNFVSWKRT